MFALYYLFLVWIAPVIPVLSYYYVDSWDFSCCDFANANLRHTVRTDTPYSAANCLAVAPAIYLLYMLSKFISFVGLPGAGINT